MDGLEDELDGKASVLRANLQTTDGRQVASRFGIDVVPSYVVVAGDGEVVLRVNGAAGVPAAEIRRAVRRE